MARYPELGDPAPFFSAPVAGGDYRDGDIVALPDLEGEWVVLYFYPKDDTPGCTVQACGLRDAWGEIGSRAKIFGLSVDSVESHREFIDKFGLPFPLIADLDKAIVEKYGVWIEKTKEGRSTMGIERTTFLIGPDGRIAAVFPRIDPGEHINQLLSVLP